MHQSLGHGHVASSWSAEIKFWSILCQGTQCSLGITLRSSAKASQSDQNFSICLLLSLMDGLSGKHRQGVCVCVCVCTCMCVCMCLFATQPYLKPQRHAWCKAHAVF